MLKPAIKVSPTAQKIIAHILLPLNRTKNISTLFKINSVMRKAYLSVLSSAQQLGFGSTIHLRDLHIYCNEKLFHILEPIRTSVHFRPYRYWKQNITQIEGDLLIILVDPTKGY